VLHRTAHLSGRRAPDKPLRDLPRFRSGMSKTAHCTARADDRTLVGDVIALFAVDGEEPLPGPLLGG
jgi:hypothetical protein